MNSPVWGVVLIAGSVLIGILEIFVPSAGVFALVAAVFSIGGVVALFMHDTMWGLAGLGFVLLFFPALTWFGVKFWTDSAIGRKLLGISDKPAEEQEAREREQSEQAAALHGKRGEAVTDLRPVGVIKIEGQRYDAFAEVRMIEAGAEVVVTDASGLEIKVRPV